MTRGLFLLALLASGCAASTPITDFTPDEAQACLDTQAAYAGAARRLGCPNRTEVCPIARVYVTDAIRCVAERSGATSCEQLDAAAVSDYCYFTMPVVR